MLLLVKIEFPLRISLYIFLKSLIIDMIKHVTITKNGISLYTFLKSLIIIIRTLNYVTISKNEISLYTFLKSLIIDMIKHVTISKNRISLRNFLVNFLKKFNNRHALRIRLIGLNK